MEKFNSSASQQILQLLQTQSGSSPLLGKAPAFLQAIAPLPRIARSEAAAILCGETGTGKEMAARAIHYWSARAAGPFVPVNCGSLPDSLLEAELFGHERGAFTDARDRRTGLIAQAEQGTLFLDEIDTLPLKAQIALLRVLQDKRFRPIGASGERQANVRIVAATNAPLAQLAQAGQFRADLYYRLCVFQVVLPPLRERKADLLMLAQHFLAKHTTVETTAREFSPQAAAAMAAYDWPGNVRELENAVIRGLCFCQSKIIEADDLGLPAPVAPSVSPAGTPVFEASFKARKEALIENFEREYLMQLLTAHGGNVTQAARTAGKERRDLGKLLKKHQLNPLFFRQISRNYSL